MHFICQYNFIHIVTLLHFSGLKGPSSGSADTFREHGQQNTSQRCKYQIKKKLIIRTWLFSNLSHVIISNINTNQKVKPNSRTIYLKALWWATNQVYWINFDQFLLVSLIITIMLKYKIFFPLSQRSPHYRCFMITLRHTTLGRIPLDEWSTRRRDFYETMHNTHTRQPSLLAAEFESAIPAGERPQTHALARAVTAFGC
jgi:hypothetical protein